MSLLYYYHKTNTVRIANNELNKKFYFYFYFIFYFGTWGYS